MTRQHLVATRLNIDTIIPAWLSAYHDGGRVGYPHGGYTTRHNAPRPKVSIRSLHNSLAIRIVPKSHRHKREGRGSLNYKEGTLGPFYQTENAIWISNPKRIFPNCVFRVFHRISNFHKTARNLFATCGFLTVFINLHTCEVLAQRSFPTRHAGRHFLSSTHNLR